MPICGKGLQKTLVGGSILTMTHGAQCCFLEQDTFTCSLEPCPMILKLGMLFQHLGLKALQSLYKRQPWVYLDLFYGSQICLHMLLDGENYFKVMGKNGQN